MRRTIFIACFLAVATAGGADAGEMAFKFHKRIWPLEAPYPKGINLVALPWVNPYVDAEDICRVFSQVPGKGRVWQIDPGSGRSRSHTCNDYDPFALMPRVGLFVANTVMTSGVLVGSFPEPAAPGYHLYPRASPHPVGLNLFSVPYNATALTLDKMCLHMGLPFFASRIIRIDARTGVTVSVNCGETQSPFLVLGEAVMIEVTQPMDVTLPHY